jgi:hypothetical protein
MREAVPTTKFLLEQPRPASADFEGSAPGTSHFGIIVKPIGLVAPRLQALGLSTSPARETYHGGQEDLDQSARPEGAMFVDYVATQSCASGRNAFFTGMFPCAPA